MSKSEVERHKMWEHPVPISPFEDRLAVANRDVNPEDLQKLTSTVGRSSDDTAIIGGGQRRRVPFRPFRI